MNNAPGLIEDHGWEDPAIGPALLPGGPTPEWERARKA
jgi:hypothetical protein